MERLFLQNIQTCGMIYQRFTCHKSHFNILKISIGLSLTVVKFCELGETNGRKFENNRES